MECTTAKERTAEGVEKDRQAYQWENVIPFGKLRGLTRQEREGQKDDEV